MYDGVMDAATYVRVQSIFFEVTVVFSCTVTYYVLGSVADSLVRCARGTASTSLVLPSTSSSGTYTGTSYAAGSARWASSSPTLHRRVASYVPRVALLSLRLCLFYFCGPLSGPLRFVSVL